MTGESLPPEFLVFVRTWIGLDKGFDYDRFRTLHDTEMGDALEKQGWVLGSRGELIGWQKGSAFVSQQRFLCITHIEKEARLVAKHLEETAVAPHGGGALKYGWLDTEELETGEEIAADEGSHQSTVEHERCKKSLEVVRRREARRAQLDNPAGANRKHAPAPEGWIYLSEAAEKYGVPKSTLHDWISKPLADARCKDDDSGQVRVEEQKLRELLVRKGRRIS